MQNSIICKLSYYINVKENIINSMYFRTVRSLSLPFQQLHFSLTVLQNTKIRAIVSTECVTRSITEGQKYIFTSLIAVPLI